MARAVKIKPTESFCLKCGRMLPIDEFYKSVNTNHELGVQPYCKSCANGLTNAYLSKYGSMEAAIYYTCADTGMPFIKKVYDTFMEKVKERNIVSYWGNYSQGFQTNRSKADKEAWTGFDATDVDFKDIKSIQKSEKALLQEKEELKYRWGEDKNLAQLQYLESRWEAYVKNMELDVAQEQLYRNLCLAELDIWEGNDIDKAMKRQLDMMKSLGIDKFEASRGKTDAEKMIEYDIWLMENEEPAEYYKNKGMYKDFRGIHSAWIKEIKRPVINLITGSKDYDIELDDKEEWEERNKEDLDDE